LADLGFCKIAGSDLIFRHSALRTPFGDNFPRARTTIMWPPPPISRTGSSGNGSGSVGRPANH
jgi:hypothetical protein